MRPNGRLVADFTQGVGGVYEAIREGDAVYFLANLQFVDPKEFAQPADLIGNWIISRPTGNAACQLVFTDQPSQDEGFQLSVRTRLRRHAAALRSGFLAPGARRRGAAIETGRTAAFRQTRSWRLGEGAGTAAAVGDEAALST